MPEPRECVEDSVFDVAEDFLNHLSPRHAQWECDPSAWVHRGHANAEWWLRPRLVRELEGNIARHGISTESTHPGHPVPITPGWSRTKHLQDRLLSRFRVLLERSDIHIPTWPPKTDLSMSRTQASGAEPLFEAFPLMALAQQHALPTILLDWSRRAYVAAYFAAREAADPAAREPASTELSVVSFWRGPLDAPSEGPRFYDLAGSTNPNLRAQAGLFTLLSSDADNPTLEGHVATINRLTGGARTVRRCSLPIAEAGRLLRLLSYEGITGATMFPGTDGIVKAMQETALWDRLPRVYE